MFDIRDAAARSCDGELTLPFKYWVIMPSIGRAAWSGRWGDGAFAPPELLFAEDLPHLAGIIREAGQRALANQGLQRWPADQFASVWRAFGDSSVLYHLPEEREARRVPEATLGELFDEAADAYKTLSDEQQRLSAQDWAGGPRLVRGVAGSGKTIVLANNLARRLGRSLGGGDRLFEEMIGDPGCWRSATTARWSRSSDRRSTIAFRQRTGRRCPRTPWRSWHYNRLL